MKRLSLNTAIKPSIKGIIFLSIAFFWVFTSVHSQDRLGFGIMRQNHLYINEFNQEEKSTCFLEITMDTDSVKKTCRDFYFNSLIDFRGFGWDVKDEGYVSVVIEYLTRLPSEANMKFIQEDLPAIFYRIPHVGYWVRREEIDTKPPNAVYWPAALDITVANDTIWLLHRRNRAIDVWYAKMERDKTEQTDPTWHHKFTYLADSVETTSQFSYDDSRLVPTTDSFSPASIPESYIRFAKLKLIWQNGYFFIINLSHGEIYHLGEKIELVGLISKDDKAWVENYGERALLVEDRDNGRLLTSQPVIRLNATIPFPVFEKIKE